MYFYKIGDYVLAIYEAMQSYYTEGGASLEYKMLKFSENATVSVIEPGDQYVPDKQNDYESESIKAAKDATSQETRKRAHLRRVRDRVLEPGEPKLQRPAVFRLLRARYVCDKKRRPPRFPG